MSKIFALIDCNNFFASCERVFNPALRDKPVVVLSNNDGCVIARSNEAKALEIPMGAPYYKYQHIIKKHNVHVFSSNFELYGDMSHRVMETIRSFAPDIEIYSIDEAFVSLKDIPEDKVEEFCLFLKEKIRQWTGIITSIGIGPTKTLAKIATHIAKKYSATGIYDLRDRIRQDKVLAKIGTEEIWGISRKLGERLRAFMIHTALALRDSDAKLLRSHFSVVMEKTILELRGISCLDLEKVTARKNIMSSRSFGKDTSNLDDIEEAIATYTARACKVLRRQNSRAQGICVYLKGNRFKLGAAVNNGSMSYGLPVPTSDTGTLIGIAKKCVQKIYNSGSSYHKAGIMLMELVADSDNQGSFFASEGHNNKSDKLMSAMDQINRALGKDTVFHAAEGTTRKWMMKCDKKSSGYTTKWNELVTARA